MDDADSLSFRKLSNKLAALFFLASITASIAVEPMPTGMFYTAIFSGILWGTLRNLGFGRQRWENSVIIVTIVMLQSALRSHYQLKIQERAFAGYLQGLAFISLATLTAMFVAWIKEREDRRRKSFSSVR